MAIGIKTGGRTAGTLNKNTSELRERFALLIENNFDKLQNDIDLLEPKDRIKVILELAKFVVPTLKAIELSTGNENGFNPIVINLGAGINPDEVRTINA
jgi:hypothetical protein